MPLPFFAPDFPLNTADLLSMVSAIPTTRGYACPPGGATTDTPPLPATSQGGALLFQLDGGARTFAWTQAALYELSGGVWVDVSRGGGYAIGANRGCFAQFGDTSLTINKATQLQQSSTGNFADVPNSPKASTMEVLEGFVFLGDCDDTGTGLPTTFGDEPHRYWLSGSYDFTQWDPTDGTADAANLCVSGLLVETSGGITRHLRLNGDMVTYKAKSMYVGRLDSSPQVVTYKCVATDVGCPARDGVVAAGSLHYFMGDDDMYAFDGVRPVSIGEPLKDWLFARINRPYISSVQALHDRVNSLIFWFYPVAAANDPQALTSCVVYHYATQRWGAFDLTVTDVLQAVTSSITYDTLGNYFSTYDDLPEIPFDSPFWSANTPVLGYFDNADTLLSLSGSAPTWSLTSGYSGDASQVWFCDRVQPQFRTAPGSGTCFAFAVMNLGETAYMSPIETLQNGRFPVQITGRFIGFQVDYTDFGEQQTAMPRLTPAGFE